MSCISSCSFSMFPFSLHLVVSDRANLQPFLAGSTVCRALGVGDRAERLHGAVWKWKTCSWVGSWQGFAQSLLWGQGICTLHLKGVLMLLQECWLLPWGSALHINATTAKEMTSKCCFNKHKEGFLSPSPTACSLLSLVLFLRGCIFPAVNWVACEWSKSLHLVAPLFLDCRGVVWHKLL